MVENISGEIFLSRALTDEERNEFEHQFGNGAISIYITGTVLCLEDWWGKYVDEDLEVLASWFRQRGISFEEGSTVEYYGDYDGMCRYEHGTWEIYEANAVINMSDVELIAELEHRGYVVARADGGDTVVWHPDEK